MKWHEVEALLDRRASEDLASKCESPIERILADWIQFEFELRFPPNTIEVIPQFKLARFRYDFAIRFVGEEIPLLLIECDGKEFHSTPDQRANDVRKEWAAQDVGAQCLRYTGSDIYRFSNEIAKGLADVVAFMRRLK